MRSSKRTPTAASEAEANPGRTEPTGTEHDSHSTLACRRRGLLRTVGGLTAAGLLAGCASDGSGGGPADGEGNDPASVDDWLANTGNYDGLVDRTGEDGVTVEVGAAGNAGSNAFAPAAVEVSPGTTVTWEWVDGHHNVVTTDGAFDSGRPERDATFERGFESTGTTYYYCDPHESAGMKGAVVVTDDDDP